MKLLFAIKALNNIQGGAERVLADVTSGLSDRGHELSILSFDQPNGQPFYPLNKKIERLCLDIGNTQKRSTATEFINRIKALRNEIKRENPDAVVAFMHSMFIPVAFALIGTRIPVVASEHIVPKHYKSRRIEYFLLLLSSLFVSKITVLSENVKQSYPRFLHKKMVVIANPVHAAEKLAAPEGETHKSKIILNVGRLDPQKNQKLLIHAFDKLAKEYPDWNLRIIGEGTLRLELEQLIKTLMLENRIQLPGTTKDIEKEYQKAHIFALPSDYESFGLATAEAMTHNLPVVGFADCPGTNELITDQKNGILVQTTSSERVEPFYLALKTLIDNPKLRITLANEAQKRALDFNPDRITEKWEVILQSYAKSTRLRTAK